MFHDVLGPQVIVPQLVPYLCDLWSALVVPRLARRRASVARRRAALGPLVVRAVLRTEVLRVAPLQVAPLTTRLHHRSVGQLVLVVGPVEDVDRRQEAVGMVLRTCTVLEPVCGSFRRECSPSGSCGIPSGSPIYRTIGTSLGLVNASDSSLRFCLHMQGIPDRLVVVE